MFMALAAAEKRTESETDVESSRNSKLTLSLALVIYYAGQRSLLIMKEHLVNSIMQLIKCSNINITSTGIP